MFFQEIQGKLFSFSHPQPVVDIWETRRWLRFFPLSGMVRAKELIPCGSSRPWAAASRRPGRPAGLSQESLGERLGVSRQAVSKWEADAAVPELENLIAMSRIFGVTIGALLGVEPEAAEDRSEKDAPEAPGEGVEGTAPAGELTDRELAAVEAIAKKYLDAAQVVQNPRWSRKKKSP